MRLCCCITGMEKSAPSRLANLRELVSLLSLSVQIQTETSGILEDYEKRLYSLEEDRRRLLADYRTLDMKCQSLEKRYAELLYTLSDIRSGK